MASWQSHSKATLSLSEGIVGPSEAHGQPPEGHCHGFEADNRPPLGRDTHSTVASFPIMKAGSLRNVTGRLLKPGDTSRKATDKPDEATDIAFEVTDTPNEAAGHAAVTGPEGPSGCYV